MKLISKKWVIFIIMVFPIKYNNSSPKVLRYTEIKDHIRSITSTDISDTILSLRLNELVKYKILKKNQYAEIPPRVEYQLTTKGINLKNSLLPLIEWGINDCHKG
ncbi:MAG: winged helix-turn-helix transcriptional regulator [Candidatus Hermodarchaeota archaeon]